MATALRVAINGQLLSLGSSYRNAGVGQYIVHLLEHLVPQEGEQFLVFVPPNADRSQLPRRSGLRYLPTAFPTHKPGLRALWEQAILPARLLRHHVDVVHSPVNVVPAARIRGHVVTVHDLSFVTHPENFPPTKRQYQRWFTRLSVSRASRVLTDSESTRRDLMSYFDAPASRVTTVYPGVTAGFRRPAPEHLRAVRERAGLTRPYFLHVGTLQPRKNLTRLVEAFASAREQDRLPHVLVLAGGKGWMYEGLLRRVRELGLRDEVLFPGYVDVADLPAWYAGADALVYPSLYEGFGFPVVEAMACGTPVVCSNVSSMPELAGDAALLVSPHDVPAMAAALGRIASDHHLRRELAERGPTQARRFTWESTARGVQEAYRSVGARSCA